MDNEWQWEQEFIKLQHENKRLRNEFATYKVDQIPESVRKDGKIFTNQELKFIRENNLNYGRVYALVHRRDSAKDALIETLEGIL
ncbi:hypothetical protein H7992_14450 [Sporosarcina sp. resist]|uniref:hypothetical protein n=1 Tax=Sporosarcina sp. resist TaxID=2762563 RepID=UPI00164EB779|nr:hypothetical protein [Sporosarcina sp. resist]QNK86460.1 hypothetical protein H7992_14450 [Sporosarcina sp. resist]